MMPDPRLTITAWLPHLILGVVGWLGVGLACWLLAPVMHPLLVASAVVLLSHDVLYAPLARLGHRWLTGTWTSLAEPLAAAVSVGALTMGAVGAALLVLWSALGGLSLTVDAVIDLIRQDPAKIRLVAERLARRGEEILHLYPGLPWSSQDLRQTIDVALSHLALGPQMLAYLATGTSGLIVELAFTAMATAGLYIHGPRLVRLVGEALPLADPVRHGLRQRLASRTNDLIGGTIARALVLGFAHGVTAWLIGGFSPVLVTVVAIFAVLLPMIGSAFVWLPLASLLAGQGHWWLAILLAVTQQTAALAVAWFTRRHASAQPLAAMGFLVVVFLVGAVLACGVRGLVLAPAAALITITLVDVLRTMYTVRPE